MSDTGENRPRSDAPVRIPRGIWALGLVSLLMDTSSELIHSLLPVFLVSVLGASTLSLGLIEGVAEGTAAVVKVFSGTLSDYLGHRKWLAVAGYGLAALTKPMFPLASSVGWVFAARFLDRVGKGIRGAPRDALIGDLAPAEIRGASYGLRQALDTVGAFAGPLLAMAFMFLLNDRIHWVFWIAVVPAVLSVVVLVFGVREPEETRPDPKARSPIRMADIRGFAPRYWVLLGIAALLMMARFSEAFLVIRAQDAGLPIAWVPAVMVVMSLVYSLSAYPAGKLSDGVGRRGLLALGVAFLVAADSVLAFANHPALVFVGVAIWGLHMGFSQGLMATIIADAIEPRLRGTAFGLFNLASGAAMVAASVLAGWLWEAYSPEATFLAGAAFALLSLVGLGVYREN